MATIITNQATLNYRYGTATATAVSNVATSVLNQILEITKDSLNSTYRIGQTVTYIITVTNNGSNESQPVTVVDDLGTYAINGNDVTPLTYNGPAQLFINGVLESVLTPEIEEGSVTFNIPAIPAGGNAQIIYLATVNEFASGASGSQITNTATADSDCDCPCDEAVSDSNTITAEEFADVRIVKSVCPNPAVCDGELTYTFDIFNYGNIAATEVVLTDTFIPPLTDIEVYVNGTLIPEDDYSYINGTLTLPDEDSDLEISVPAASFAVDDETGNITLVPGQIQIIVRGNL